MKTAIELHELAKVRLAFAPSPMRPPLPRPTPQSGRQHPATQRLVMDGDPVFTGQVLGRQRRPKPLVDPAAVFLAHQREHSLANLPRRRPI
jgi:hypothetical protein